METEAAAVVWPQLGPPGTLEAGRGRERHPLEPPEGARAGAFGSRAGGSNFVVLSCDSAGIFYSSLRKLNLLRSFAVSTCLRLVVAINQSSKRLAPPPSPSSGAVLGAAHQPLGRPLGSPGQRTAPSAPCVVVLYTHTHSPEDSLTGEKTGRGGHLSVRRKDSTISDKTARRRATRPCGGEVAGRGKDYAALLGRWWLACVCERRPAWGGN